ncbi:MAG: hypothetical protein EXS31_06540 [Pedosphaera sp.]|nr:hypothetical protein [Pedosphaera sp.]
MKRKIKYADSNELNGEPIGNLGAPARLDFLPSPDQVRQSLKTVEITVLLEPTSLEYYQREARRRGATVGELNDRDRDGRQRLEY